MAQQLIYTSVQAGLDIGRSGFCTVAKTESIKKALATELESISHYDFQAKNKKPIFSYRLSSVGGHRYYICSRISPCGVDYTGRTNFIAHHVAFEENEIRDYVNPAHFMLNWTDWCSEWKEAPRFLTKNDNVNFEVLRNASTVSVWKALSKEKNKDFLLSGSRYFSFVDIDEKSYLKLLSESFSARKMSEWEYSFTTRLQKNEPVRSYSIVLDDASIALPSDFLRISPTKFSLNEDLIKGRANANASSASLDKKNLEENYKRERMSASLSFEKKRDYFSLYLILTTVLASSIALGAYFIFFKDNNSYVEQFAIAEKNLELKEEKGNDTFTHISFETEAEIPVAEAPKEEIVPVVEVVQAKRIEEETKVVEQRGVNPKQKRALSLLGANIGYFSNVENIFLMYQQTSSKYLFNGSEFKSLYNTTNPCDSKLVDIKYKTIPASLEFDARGISMQGKDEKKVFLYASNPQFQNAHLERPFFLNLSLKDTDEEYSLFFVDNKSIALNCEFKDFYKENSFVLKDDIKEALDSLILSKVVVYEIEMKNDSNAVFARILQRNSRDYNTLAKQISTIEESYKEFLLKKKALDNLKMGNAPVIKKEQKREFDYRFFKKNRAVAEATIKNIVYRTKDTYNKTYYSSKMPYEERLKDHLTEAMDYLSAFIKEEEARFGNIEGNVAFDIENISNAFSALKAQAENINKVKSIAKPELNPPELKDLLININKAYCDYIASFYWGIKIPQKQLQNKNQNAVEKQRIFNNALKDISNAFSDIKNGQGEDSMRYYFREVKYPRILNPQVFSAVIEERENNLFNESIKETIRDRSSIASINEEVDREQEIKNLEKNVKSLKSYILNNFFEEELQAKYLANKNELGEELATKLSLDNFIARENLDSYNIKYFKVVNMNKFLEGTKLFIKFTQKTH